MMLCTGSPSIAELNFRIVTMEWFEQTQSEIKKNFVETFYSLWKQYFQTVNLSSGSPFLPEEALNQVPDLTQPLYQKKKEPEET